MSETTVTARDGARFVVDSTGSGPGVVVVHGGAVDAGDYRRFAAGLADQFTVHRYHRRGRPGGADLPASGYSLQLDLDDLAVVLDHTGARMVFGHSVGGFIALQAALALPIDRLGVYDPAVDVDGEFPTHFLDDFEAAVVAGDAPRALAIVSRGLHSVGPLSDLPMPVQVMMGRLFLRTPIGQRWRTTLPTVPAEARAAANHAGPASLYAGIRVEVLLAAGGRSPAYYQPICQKLASAIPKARFECLPGMRHDAPNIARAAFLRPFAEFFGGE